MADPERSLHVNRIRIQSSQRVALAASSETSCSTVRWLGLLSAAAQELGEETCETETNGRHAYADDAYFPLDHGP